MNALVVSFDHLHLAYLGCYGNAGIQTPQLDRLAADAAVFDQHFTTQIWLPEDAPRDDPSMVWGLRGDAAEELRRRLLDAGVATRLLAGPDAVLGPPGALFDHASMGGAA